MENKDLLSSNMSLDYQAKTFLGETAKWAKFLAILGFIGSAFIVLAALMMFVVGVSSFSGLSRGTFGMIGGGVIGFLYLIIAAVGIFTSLMLYRFATQAQAALASEDSAALSSSLGNLRNYFRILGIITIIYLGFAVLAIIFGVVGTMMNI